MKITHSAGVIIATALVQFGSLFYPSFTLAANLTVAKNTLQSSRMSFYGRVKSPTVSGSSHVWIYTVASAPANSITTAGLKPGDTITIGVSTYTIANIVDDDEFTITTTLASGDADDTDVIYFKAKPQQVVTFNTASAINGGFFRVLIPAATSGQNDTVPDITGFDFNTAVTALGTNASGYTFLTGVATVSGATGCTFPANYHCFEFHYTGTGGVGTAIELKIGETTGANSMIAPAPSTGRVAYTADTYTFIVQNFPNGSDPNTIDPTDDVQGKIAVIESVRVTATVDPSITFKIEGVSDTTSACSLTTDIATTATAVPFGVLTLDTFKVGAQLLTVSTNAATGYSVTGYQNNRLSNLAVSPSYIPDTTCDSGTCTHTTSGAWATAAGHPGFGYTVAVVANAPTIAPTAPNYQHFPSVAETPFQIMSNNTIASAQAVHVCYKIAVDATQAAGEYENQVTYTATASF